jgi:hypothetical protein
MVGGACGATGLSTDGREGTGGATSGVAVVGPVDGAIVGAIVGGVAGAGAGATAGLEEEQAAPMREMRQRSVSHRMPRG